MIKDNKFKQNQNNGSQMWIAGWWISITLWWEKFWTKLVEKFRWEMNGIKYNHDRDKSTTKLELQISFIFKIYKYPEILFTHLFKYQSWIISITLLYSVFFFWWVSVKIFKTQLIFFSQAISSIQRIFHLLSQQLSNSSIFISKISEDNLKGCWEWFALDCKNEKLYWKKNFVDEFPVKQRDFWRSIIIKVNEIILWVETG